VPFKGFSRNVFLLGVTSFLNDVATEMIYPLLPLFLTSKLGVAPAVIGVIEGVAESTASLLKVVGGYWSDRTGMRKPIAFLGYATAPLSRIVLYLAVSWPIVLLSRVIDRIGKGIRTAPRDALIADSTAPEVRGAAFGFHRALDTAGAAVGVVIAYLFLTANQNDYSSVFLWSIVPALLGTLVLLGVREHHTTPKPDAVNTQPLLLSPARMVAAWRALPRKLKVFLLIALIFTLGNSSNQFLLLRADNLGLTPSLVILAYLLFNVVYAVLSYPFGRLSDRIGRKTLLVSGYLFYAAVYVGFALAGDAAWVWPLFAAYAFYIALTEGVEKAFVSDIAPPELRATLIGLHATILGIGLLPASALAGWLWGAFGAPAPFYFGGVMGLLAALGLWLLL
jgi:MFS family permease